MELAAEDQHLVLRLLDHVQDRKEVVAGPDRKDHTYCTFGDRQGADGARELGGMLVSKSRAESDTRQEACP